MKVLITEVVFTDEDCYDIPTGASEFIAFWQEKLDLVPVAHKSTAFITVEPYECYSRGRPNGSAIKVVVGYKREEDKGEII